VAGFSTWYHASSRDAARSIAQSGLTARRYGANLDGLGSAYHVLARERHQTEGLTQAKPDDRAIVTLHVPDDPRAEHLTCSDGPCHCGGVYSGLFKPVPVRMVWSVEDI
jgi:hypothetical protein